MKLTYRNLEKDIEKYLDIYGEWDHSGLTPMVRGYDKARDFVFQSYMAEEAYEAVVTYVLKFNHEVGHCGEVVDPISDALVAQRNEPLLTKLWRGIIDKQKKNFWYLWRRKGKLPHLSTSSLPKAKTLALQSMETYRQILANLGEVAKVIELETQIDRLQREVK